MKGVGLRRYLDLLRAPGAGPLLAGAAIGRLPYGMNVLALILLLRAEGLSYAEVGIVTGSAWLAVGATAPGLGRLVDRLGQTRLLVSTACLSLAAQAGLMWAALSGAGVVSLTALALVSGAATPPVSPCLRTLWSELVGRDRLDTAYAFDALQLELFFVAGPLLAAGIAAGVAGGGLPDRVHAAERGRIRVRRSARVAPVASRP
jgi:MFS family permease